MNLAKLLAVALCILSCLNCAYAQGYALFGPQLGGGSAYTTAMANGGGVLNSGLNGGSQNPATYVTDKNEMMIEGLVWTMIPTSIGVESEGIRGGFGAVSYLISKNNHVFVYGYHPRQRLQGGAHYSSHFPAYKVSNRLAYNNIEVSYARKMNDKLNLGTTLRLVRGEYAFGTIAENSNRLETLYRPNYLEAVFGLQQKVDDFGWEIVVQPFGWGKISIQKQETELNRSKKDKFLTGPLSFKVGLGKNLGDIRIMSDFTWIGSNKMETDESPGSKIFAENGNVMEIGVNFSYDFDLTLKMMGGFRHRFQSHDAGEFHILGLGVEYMAASDYSFVGSLGMLIARDDIYDQTPLGDTIPIVARVGFRYFGN